MTQKGAVGARGATESETRPPSRPRSPAVKVAADAPQAPRTPGSGNSGKPKARRPSKKAVAQIHADAAAETDASGTAAESAEPERSVAVKHELAPHGPAGPAPAEPNPKPEPQPKPAGDIARALRDAPDDPLHTSLRAVAQTLHRARRCVVITGAGISVSAGIPDFRSADGLYKVISQKYPHLAAPGRSGKDLFDAHLFREPKTRELFYVFMAELRAMALKASPTPTHAFMRRLSTSGKLLRCYSQNIDGLEARAGLQCDLADGKAAEVVQLHGSLDVLVCTLCRYETRTWLESHERDFAAGVAPACPQCEALQERRARAGMRERGAGFLRPDIVLYNEFHAKGDLIASIAAADARRKPDCLIVMGTSLRIPGLKQLIRQLAGEIRDRHPALTNDAARPLRRSSQSADNFSTAETAASTGPKSAAAGPKSGKAAAPTPRIIFINKTPSSKEWRSVFDTELMVESDTAVAAIEAELDRLESAVRERAAGRERRQLARELADQQQSRVSRYFRQKKEPVVERAGVKDVGSAPLRSAAPLEALGSQ